MRARGSILSIGLLALTLPACAHVPGLPHLEPGQRVRIQLRDVEPPRRTGTVVALTADSLAIRPDGEVAVGADGPRVAFPVAAIKKVEISTGTHRQTLAGMYHGGQIGLIAMLLGTLAGEWLAGDAESMGVFAGCVAAGGVIGTFVRSEDWRQLPLSSVHVSLGPHPADRFWIEASVALRR